MAMTLEGNGSNHNGFFAAESGEINEPKHSQSSEGSASPSLEGRRQASCEDTASKTIDFLRARLLAERATSRAAKDCAQQNAKRVLELERMLEIEVELKKKAEAAMQEMMAKLREADHSARPSRLSPDQSKLEKQIKIEDRVHVEDVASPNTTCIPGIAEAEVENPSLKDMPQDENSSSNSIQSQSLKQRREGSNDLDADDLTLDEYRQSTGSIIEESELSIQNKAENDEGREGSNDLNTDGAICDEYQLNTGSVVEQSHSPDHNKVVNGEGRRGSNDLYIDGTAFDEYQQNTGSDVEEGQVSNRNRVDNDNHNILSNPIPLLRQENSSSADHGESLKQDKESAEASYAYQNYATSENLTDGDMAINRRIKVEENLRELCNQIRKEVAALGSLNQNEFVRLKLHELVDQVVGTADAQLHKHKAATLGVSSRCSKSSVLGCTGVQQDFSGNNIEGSKLQMELANRRKYIMDDMEANKSFDSNIACDYSHHTERAAAACSNSLISTRHANENQRGRRYYATGENMYNLQCSVCSDALLTGKQVPCVRELLEKRKHVSFVQNKMSNVQSCLGNSKTDVNLQSRTMPESCCDDCFKEFHLKTKCLMCKTAPHGRLYCNNEKTIQVKRNCSHNQAAITMECGACWDLSRASRSEGFMPRHCGFLNTNYPIQNADTRAHERREIAPGKSLGPEGRPAPLKSFHDCLPMQRGEGPSYVSDSYGNARNMKLYSEHGPVPLISMRWGPRGSPLNFEEFQSSQMGKVGDALIALRHAKEQIRTAIDKT